MRLFRGFLAFVFLCKSTDSQILCPDRTMPYDYEDCDPNRRSQCPEGFTCRAGSLSSSPDQIVHVCCSTINMSIGDWLTEAALTPSVIPYIPLVKLTAVYIVDPSNNASSPPIHTGDEVIALSYPNYVTASIAALTFPVPPVAGGFLHVLTMIDPGEYPYALLLAANVLAPSSVNCIVSSQNSPDFLYFISNATVPAGSLSYRHQYVILVFSTPTQLQLPGNGGFGNALVPTQSSLMSGCDGALMNDLSCFFTTSTIGSQLGSPLAGSLFYLTTVRSPFPTTTDNFQRDQASTSLSFNLSMIFTLILLFLRTFV